VTQDHPGVECEFVALDSPTGRTNGAGFHPGQGLYFTPTGKRPKVALIASHYNVDFSEHYLAPLMAERGFGFLGWNTRYEGAEGWFQLEHALIDIGVGVRWLREHAGVETVVLMGNCGGGSLMVAYQSQALAPNITGVRGHRVPDAVNDLLPADLFVSLQAHPGRPEVLTNWMDPSITDETDPLSRDPELDMYAADRSVPYEPEFVAAYRAAQVERNHRITDWCHAELDRLEAAGAYDRSFNLNRVWADLRFRDVTIDPSDRPDNSCLGGDPKWANESPYGIGALCTARNWLSMWSLRDSQCQGAPHLRRVTTPALVVQSTADVGVFPSDAQIIHDALASPDKDLVWIEGDHYLENPGNARGDVADLLTSWIAVRA
jgi:pimeloyl-ACP methyl ester carboxylesterase